MTLIGNAVYMSMDIPDVFLAVSLFLVPPPLFFSPLAIDLQDSQLLAIHSGKISCFFNFPLHMDVSHSPCPFVCGYWSFMHFATDTSGTI